MIYLRSRLGDAGQGGYTYVGLLIFVAVFGLISAGSLRVGVTAQRRVAEQELLERGLALTRALESYSEATPAGQSGYPQVIGDLLLDPRHQKKIVRHLRRIDVDPITGRAEWGVVMTPDKRWIIGFHSVSDQKSWRRDFPAPFGDFSEKPFYRDWVFSAGLGE